MEELVEKLVVFGYAEKDAEQIIDLFMANGGYGAARDFVLEKERELCG